MPRANTWKNHRKKKEQEELQKEYYESKLRTRARVILILSFVAIVLLLYSIGALLVISERTRWLNTCIVAYNELSLEYFHGQSNQPDLVWHYNYNSTEYKCSALLCQDEKENDCDSIKLSCLSCCIQDKNETR